MNLKLKSFLIALPISIILQSIAFFLCIFLFKDNSETLPIAIFGFLIGAITFLTVFEHLKNKETPQQKP